MPCTVKFIVKAAAVAASLPIGAAYDSYLTMEPKAVPQTPNRKAELLKKLQPCFEWLGGPSVEGPFKKCDVEQLENLFKKWLLIGHIEKLYSEMGPHVAKQWKSDQWGYAALTVEQLEERVDDLKYQQVVKKATWAKKEEVPERPNDPEAFTKYVENEEPKVFVDCIRSDLEKGKSINVGNLRLLGLLRKIELDISAERCAKFEKDTIFTYIANLTGITKKKLEKI